MPEVKFVHRRNCLFEMGQAAFCDCQGNGEDGDTNMPEVKHVDWAPDPFGSHCKMVDRDCDCIGRGRPGPCLTGAQLLRVVHRGGCSYNRPTIMKCDCGADCNWAELQVGQKTIEERAKIRGDFREQAEVSQRLKDIFHVAKWDALSDAQREALDNMANKMARILTGDPNEADSWLDLAGYSTLIHNIITKGSTT